MNNLRKIIAAGLALLFGSLLMTGSAGAQALVAEPVQVLDTVEVFCPTCAQNMKFDNAERINDDFELLFDVPGADFIACTRDPGGDFLCLDRSDKKVKKWPGTSPAILDDVFSCEDDALGLNTRKANTCTGYTFGLDAHFLAGLNKGRTFSLIQITAPVPTGGDPDGCGSASKMSDPAGSCAKEIYTGRPLLLDIKPIQNAVADDFTFGPGIIGLEERSTTSFFKIPVASEPIELADKKDWGLRGKVTLDSVDVMQVDNPVTTLVDNYVFVTTSDHRILAKKLDSDLPVIELYRIADERLVQADPAAVQCNFDDDQHYGLKVSEKSNVAYLTDGNYCQTVALEAVFDVEDDGMGGLTGTGDLMSLEAITETTPTVADRNLILSTSGTAGTFSPVGAATSPGVNFSLLDPGCSDDETGEGCTFISGASGASAATLQTVTVVSEESGVTVFQAKGIPFCSYKPVACFKLLDTNFDPLIDPLPTREQAIAILEGMDVLFRLPGADDDPMTATFRPEEYAFNTTSVLPQEILDRFNGPGTDPGQIPPLWMLPDYRAQLQHDFFFEALFFVTEARTDDVLTLTLNVAELQGSADLGCQTAGDLLPNYTLADLLSWDVTTRVSERDPTFDGPQSPANKNFQGTLVNAGCGTTRSRSKGISMFPYNLEMSGCPGTLDGGGNLIFDTAGSPACVLGDLESAPGSYPAMEIADDAVFAKSYVTLYDELFTHLDELVCEESAPNADDAILSQLDCGLLAANWFNGKDKLVKAFDATIQPKNSAGAQNFGAVQSQLANYRTILNAAITLGRPDPVNEVGGQSARLDTLETVMNDKLIPSIPVDGFVEDNAFWAQ